MKIPFKNGDSIPNTKAYYSVKLRRKESWNRRTKQSVWASQRLAVIQRWRSITWFKSNAANVNSQARFVVFENTSSKTLKSSTMEESLPSASGSSRRGRHLTSHSSKVVQTWERIHLPIGASAGAIVNVFKVSSIMALSEMELNSWYRCSSQRQENSHRAAAESHLYVRCFG